MTGSSDATAATTRRIASSTNRTGLRVISPGPGEGANVELGRRRVADARVLGIGIDERDRDLRSTRRADEEELVSVGHALLDDRGRQRNEQVLLDRALQGAGAQRGAEALVDQEGGGRLVDLHGPRPLPEASPRERRSKLLVEERTHRRSLERAEHHDPVDAVQELGTERRSQCLLRGRLAEPGLAGVEADARAAGDRRADVRREDDHATPEVREAAVGVGQPPVVEDLEEHVPDRLGRLLELVEQHDAEGIAADGGDQAGPPSLRRRVREQPLERVRCLELAHVDTNQPVGRAEEELGEGFRDLRLARTGRPEEEEDAEGAGRVGEPGLDHRYPVDDAAHRVGLLEDACLEECAHLLEVQRRVGIEERERETRRRCERPEDVARVEPRLTPLLGLGRGPAHQSEQVAGRRHSREELLGEVKGSGERLVVGRRVEAVVVQCVAGHGDRADLVERPQLDHVEGARHARPRFPQHFESSGGDLRDDRHRSRLDVRKQRIEEPVRAAMVLSGEEGLLELGQHPDHVPAAHRLCQLLHPAVQLTDVDGSCEHLRCRRLEHDRVVEPVERCPDQRRLAGAVLPDQEHRSARDVRE